MAGMLGLPDQEFKTSVINILKALLNKVDSMQEQIGRISRDGNPKKVSKRRARDQKHVTNEECPW